MREAEDRSMPSSLQASTSEYIGHRNYEALSSRSPDDIEEVGLAAIAPMQQTPTIEEDRLMRCLKALSRTQEHVYSLAKKGIHRSVTDL